MVCQNICFFWSPSTEEAVIDLTWVQSMIDSR